MSVYNFYNFYNFVFGPLIIKLVSAKYYQDQYLFEYVFNDNNNIIVLEHSVILCSCKKNNILPGTQDVKEYDCIHILYLLEDFKLSISEFIKMHNHFQKISDVTCSITEKHSSSNNCAICLKNVKYKCIKCEKCKVLLHKSCFLKWLTSSVESTTTCIVCNSPIYSSELNRSF